MKTLLLVFIVKSTQVHIYLDLINCSLRILSYSFNANNTIQFDLEIQYHANCLE